MQSASLKKPILQQDWNIYEEFSYESSCIDETLFQGFLKEFQDSITPRVMENSILDKGTILSMPVVIRVMTNLLTAIDFYLFPDRKSRLSWKKKTEWLLSWEVDFNFDDSPRIRKMKPDEMNVESLELDYEGRSNVIVHLTNNVKEVKRLDSGFLKGASMEIIGRLMDWDCDFDREFKILTTYFETVEKFEDRGDVCYGFIIDLYNWTFYKYCYKTNLLLRSDLLTVTYLKIMIYLQTAQRLLRSFQASFGDCCIMINER